MLTCESRNREKFTAKTYERTSSRQAEHKSRHKDVWGTGYVGKKLLFYKFS